jgi:hypothetical protein
MASAEPRGFCSTFRSFANPTPLELEQLDLRRILRDVFDPVRAAPLGEIIPDVHGELF